MNFDHPNRKVLITGKSGTGKTTLWRKIIREWPAKKVFVFDPERQFAQREGLKVAMTVEALNYATARERFVVFDPTSMFPGDRSEAFAFFSRFVLLQSRSLSCVKLYAVDELQGVQTTGNGGVPQAFKEIGDEGRRQQIDLVLVAQRLNTVNDAIRAQVNRVITFQHTDPRALVILSEMGMQPESVSSLGRFEYIDADLDTGTIKRVAKNHAPDTKGKTDSRKSIDREKA